MVANTPDNQWDIFCCISGKPPHDLQVMGDTSGLSTQVANSKLKSGVNPIDTLKILNVIISIITLIILTSSASAVTSIGTNITVDTNGSINIGSAEITSDYIQFNYLKALLGLYDLNTTTWQLKLDYAADLAAVILAGQEATALALVESAKNESLTHKGESLDTKQARISQAALVAQELVSTNLESARAKINESKFLALLNTGTLSESELEGMLLEAQNQSDLLNQTAVLQAQNISDLVNASLVEAETNFNDLITVNFTKAPITTSSDTVYTNILSLPLDAVPTLIDCEIIANASATTVGIQYWSNVTGSSSVKQFIEYYDAINSIESEWSEATNFNLLPLSSSGVQLHTTHLRIYSNQSTSGIFTLSFKSEVSGSLVSVRAPTICEKKEY